MTHSELIWERLKGALGVPPELELEGACMDDPDVDTGKATESTEEAISPPPPSEDITIEPIIATPSSNISHPPPMSLTASLSRTASINQGDGLQDIGEEAEEEENMDDPGPREEETQIHGISISTGPVSSHPHTPHALSRSASPLVSSPAGEAAEHQSLDLAASFTRRSRANSRSSVSSFMRPIG